MKAEVEIGGQKLDLEWIVTSDLEEHKPVKQVYGVCFDEKNNILIGRHDPKDAWNLPGGTPEGDESVEQTLVREASEELDAEISDIKVLGVQKVSYPSNPNKDEGDLFYQVRCVCRIKKLLPLSPDPAIDTVWERKLIPMDEITEYIKWGEIGKQIFKDAVELKNKVY